MPKDGLDFGDLGPEVLQAIDAFGEATASFEFERARGGVARDFERVFAAAVSAAFLSVDDFREGRIGPREFSASITEPARMLEVALRKRAAS